MQYHVGDRVVCLVDSPDDNHRIHVGDIGTVCKDSNGGNIYVDWGRDVGGHNCGGACRYTQGWNVSPNQVSLYEEEGQIDIEDGSFMEILKK